MGSIRDGQGRSVAYFAPNKSLFHVKLSGPPVGPALGPSALGDAVHLINIRWSEEEKARWEAYKQARTVSTGYLHVQDASPE